MYTYAFLKTPDSDLVLLPGIAGDIQVVGNAQLSAIVEPDLDLESIHQDDTKLVQAVLTHDRVICDLFWQTTILPLRFGTWFVSRDSLLAHLNANQSVYSEKLLQFAGKAEYTLKLIPQDLPEPSASDDLKGKAYFLARKQRYEMQVAQQAQQMLELHQLLTAITQTYPQYHRSEAQAGVEKVYLLLERQQEGALYQQLQQWQDQANLWELVLGEALPPYHFV